MANQDPIMAIVVAVGLLILGLTLIIIAGLVTKDMFHYRSELNKAFPEKEEEAGPPGVDDSRFGIDRGARKRRDLKAESTTSTSSTTSTTTTSTPSPPQEGPSTTGSPKVPTEVEDLKIEDGNSDSAKKKVMCTLVAGIIVILACVLQLIFAIFVLMRGLTGKTVQAGIGVLLGLYTIAGFLKAIMSLDGQWKEGSSNKAKGLCFVIFISFNMIVLLGAAICACIINMRTGGRVDKAAAKKVESKWER